MEMISIPEAAVRLHSTPEQIHRMIRNGTLVAFRHRDAVRILVDQVFLCGERVADPANGGTPPTRVTP